jgi:hypothetical protein
MILYAYIDIDNPMVAWEVAIGRIKSVDFFYTNEIYEISIWEYEMIRNFSKYGLNQKIINY